MNPIWKYKISLYEITQKDFQDKPDIQTGYFGGWYKNESKNLFQDLQEVKRVYLVYPIHCSRNGVSWGGSSVGRAMAF